MFFCGEEEKYQKFLAEKSTLSGAMMVIVYAHSIQPYFQYFSSSLTLVLLNLDIPAFANSVDPYQLAFEEAN